MPNEKAAEPLSEEKLDEFERHIRNEDCVCDYEADALALVAEVRLGREALGILEDMVDAGPYTATEGESDLRLIAKSVLRKAGLR